MQINPIPSNPFVGLRPFESAESLLFFGRGAQTGELLERLHTRRFVAVVGRSGCGKSSLIRAGLIPKLRAGFLVADRDRWVVATMKPGDRPMHNLASAVLKVTAGEPSAASTEARVKETEALAEEISAAGVEALTELLVPLLDKEDANFLLLVDQFEEIFRFGSRSRKADEDEEEEDAATARSRDEAADFVSIMLALSEQRDERVPAYVVMTMRSDFLGDCDAFYGLPEAMNQSQYLVPRLSTQQREEAISGPVRLYGQAMTPRLLDLVRNDVGDHLDQLPVMQHAMMRTWENWLAHDERRPVDVPDYVDAGTIRSALSDDAEDVLRSMGDPESEQRSLTVHVFQALTDTDSENRRIRRPAHLKRLEAITGANREKIMDVVSLFQGGGRSFLTVSPDEAAGNHLIDISHESLIRQWKTLREWMDKEAEDRSLYLRIADAAMRRKESDEGKRGGLWGDPDLQQALDWWDKRQPTTAWAAQYHKKKRKPNPAAPKKPDDDAHDAEDLYIYTEARNFLDESRRARDKERVDKEKQRKRQLNLTRLIALVIFVGLLASSGFAAIAWRQKQKADEQASLAQKNADDANAAKLVAIETAGRERTAKEKLQQSEDATLAALKTAEDNEQKAKDNELKADEAKADAQAQARIAKANAEQADKDKSIAEAERARAEEGEARNARSAYAADISLADRAFQDEEFDRGQQRLQHYLEGDAAVRSFEWCYLWRQYRRDMAAFTGHDGNVQSVAFSPDGTTLATGGADKTLRLWDTATRQSRPLTGHTESILSVAYSPDGKTVATASVDKTVKLWDAASGAEKSPPLQHPAQVNVVAYSPTGTLLATGDNEGNVMVWDTTAPGAAPRTIKAHDKGVASIAFSRDGRLLATGGDDSKANVWDTTTLAKKANIEQRDWYDGSVSGVAFSTANGETKLFAAGSSLNIFVLDLTASGEPKAGGAGQKGVAVGLDFRGSLVAVGDTDGDKDDDTLASGRNGEIKLWKLKDLKRHLLEPGDEFRWARGADWEVKLGGEGSSPFLSASFMPGKSALATGNSDGEAQLWDIRPKEARASESRKAHNDPVLGVAFAPGGELAASIGEDGTLRIWNTDGLKEINTLKGEKELGYAFESSPVEKILAGGGKDGTVSLWRVDGASITALPPLNGNKGNVNIVAFSPDGTLLVTGGSNGKVNVWKDAATPGRRLLTTLESNADSSAFALAFSADGKILAVGGEDGTVRLWDTQTWAAAGEYSMPGDSINWLSFSEDRNNRNLLISAGMIISDARVKIWDTTRPPSEEMPAPTQSKTSQGKKLWPSVVTLDAGAVWTAVFSHDGRTIATAGMNGDVRLWDALARDEEVGQTGAKYAVARRELATIRKAEKGRVIRTSRLAFSPDDRMLFGGDENGFVWLWRGVKDGEIEAQQIRPLPVASR